MLEMPNAANANHGPRVGCNHFAHRGERQAHRLRCHLLVFKSLDKLFHGGRIRVDVLLGKTVQSF